MTDVTHDHLYAILDDETADKVCRYLKGCRVSFNKHSIEHKEIYAAYIDMIGRGTTNSEAVKQLSCTYELSDRQIRRIIAKWKKK